MSFHRLNCLNLLDSKMISFLVTSYLKAYLYDVEKLQERILLQRDPTFEQKLPIRGIAWEVRKTSPAPRKLEEIRAKTPRSPRDRLSNRDKKNPQNTSNGAQTWADRLKGKSVSDTSVLPKPGFLTMGRLRASKQSFRANLLSRQSKT